MNLYRLQTSISEAKRFLERAEKLERRWDSAGREYWLPKEQGAVKRSSMDLTRSLADLRRV